MFPHFGIFPPRNLKDSGFESWRFDLSLEIRLLSSRAIDACLIQAGSTKFGTTRSYKFPLHLNFPSSPEGHTGGFGIIKMPDPTRNP